jgi:hypothetical protein
MLPYVRLMFDYQIVAFKIDYVDIFCTKKASGFVFKHQFFFWGGGANALVQRLNAGV